MAHAIQGKETAVSPGEEPCSPRRRRGIKPNVDARSRRQTVRWVGQQCCPGFLSGGRTRQAREERPCRDAPVYCRRCVVQCQLYYLFLYFYCILSYSVVR